MRKKTRKIIVDDKEYLYVINQKNHQQLSDVSLKVSLREQKNLTCTFLFCTWDDPIAGSPLLTGVHLKNKETNDVVNYNLHYPKTIRNFIVYGLNNGWTGHNIIEFQDGLEIMSKIGYDVSRIKYSECSN